MQIFLQNKTERAIPENEADTLLFRVAVDLAENMPREAAIAGLREEKDGEVLFYLRALLKEKAALSKARGMSADDASFAYTAAHGNILCLFGAKGIGKSGSLLRAAEALGVRVLFIDTVKLLAASLRELQEIFTRLKELAETENVLPCFCKYRAEEPQGKEAERRDAAGRTGLHFLLDFLSHGLYLSAWLSAEKPDELLEYELHPVFIEYPPLTVRERERLWEALAGDCLSEELSVSECASRYVVTPADLREIVRDAKQRAAFRAARGSVSAEDIREAVVMQMRNELGGLAKHIRSSYTFDDLVLSEEEMHQLRLICDQARYRRLVGEDWGLYRKSAYGHGLCVLLHGAPGTGKTMAAHALANELGLPLYRVDLSRMVSKYIGETQKNIAELFDKAENSNTLLFFDEADAMFSKRTEVSDVHDKYANSDAAYLLQRLEEYDGITVLATNFEKNLDEAFKRRIRFMVNFAYPDEETRRLLWKRLLPDALPEGSEPDTDFFAKHFELTGSGIKEIIGNAAYMAAAAGRGLSNVDLVEAVRLHFAKVGRLLKQEDFGYLGYLYRAWDSKRHNG